MFAYFVIIYLWLNYLVDSQEDQEEIFWLSEKHHKT